MNPNEAAGFFFENFGDKIISRLDKYLFKNFVSWRSNFFLMLAFSWSTTRELFTQIRFGFVCVEIQVHFDREYFPTRIIFFPFFLTKMTRDKVRVFDLAFIKVYRGSGSFWCKNKSLTSDELIGDNREKFIERLRNEVDAL